MSRVISYIESSFWACRQYEFDQLSRIAYRETDKLDAILSATEFDEKGTSNLKFDSMLARNGERLSGSRYTQIRENGVAVIDVSGVIAKRMSFFAEICFGGTSTEMLLKDFNLALESPNVTSIIFHIDSPGGEAFGIHELAEAIYAARGKKPIKAYVSGLGCSGAYWIASACDEVICDKSSFLGSIGVVTVWSDDTGFYKALGIQREVITSSNAKFKRLNINKEEDRAELMRELDSLESVFHKAVSRNRKVTVEQVKNDFNHGGVLNGIDAVKAKMADRTGSLEQLVKELAKKNKKNASYGAENDKGEFDMGFKDDFKAFASKLGFSVTESGDMSLSDDKSDSAPENSSRAGTPETSAQFQAEKDRADKAEKELAKFKADSLKNEAETFVSAEIAASRMTSAEKTEMVSLYIQAATDDAVSPLAEGSRLGNLKAIQGKRKAHPFAEEKLSGAKLLKGDETEDSKMDAEVDSQVDDYVGTVTPNKK